MNWLDNCQFRDMATILGTACSASVQGMVIWRLRLQSSNGHDSTLSLCRTCSCFVLLDMDIVLEIRGYDMLSGNERRTEPPDAAETAGITCLACELGSAGSSKPGPARGLATGVLFSTLLHTHRALRVVPLEALQRLFGR